MKKLLFTVAAAFALFCAAAEAKDSAQPTKEDPFAWEQPAYRTYTIFNLGIFPKIPGWQDNTETIGIKTGWPVVTGKNATMTGFESSWVYSGSEYVTGIQASMLMNLHKHCRGFQPAIGFNFSTETLDGMQAAVGFNFANRVRGVQASSLNFTRSMVGFQPGVIGNITEEVCGFQTGFFSLTSKLDGVQFGGVNIVTKDSTEGIQVGFVNIAKEKGMQFGLVNIIPGGKLPFMLFFNYAK